MERSFICSPLEAGAKTEALPIQTIPPSRPGGNSEKGWAAVETEEGSLGGDSRPSIELSLGIGADSVHGSGVTGSRESEFTPSQARELHLQLVVFKHIAAGLSVPTHLLVALRGCTPDSPGAHYVSLSKQHPNCMSRQGLGYSSRMLDPEPGRCRRTDGKKWRCKRDIVPLEKYCERHMHRGSKCSRKLVESSQNSMSVDLRDHSDNQKTANLNLTTLPSGNAACTTTSLAANMVYESNSRKDSSEIHGMRNITLDMNKDISNKPHINNAGERDCQLRRSMYGNCITRKSMKYRSHLSFSNYVPSGIHFSPKSVLRAVHSCGESFTCGGETKPGSTVHSCGESLSCGGETKPGPRRCRRTDGKKWRCSKDVLPGQKYCAQHMHRGAKKCVKASQPIVFAPSTGYQSSNWAKHSKEICSSKLSISTSASPKLLKNETEGAKTTSDSSCSASTDTTISDNSLRRKGYANS